MRSPSEIKAGLLEKHPELQDDLASGRLLYVYYNGFVLENRETINGGIFNNDATMPVDEWLARRDLAEPRDDEDDPCECRRCNCPLPRGLSPWWEVDDGWICDNCFLGRHAVRRATERAAA